MDNTVIRPFQELLLDAFDKILAFNGITLNLYFKTLQPLEFVEIDTEIVDDETIEEETGVEQLSADPNEPYQLGEDDTQVLLGSLKADEMTDDWEFVDKRDHNDSMMSYRS